MIKNPIQDERVVAQKRKIGNDAFGFLYFGLLISILIQQFFFDAPFSQYAAEFILFMTSAIYVLVRNIVVGNNLFTRFFQGHRILIVASIVCGLTIAAFTTKMNVVKLGLDKMGGASGIAVVSLITFSFGALASFAGFECLYWINKKRQKQIDKQFTDIDE